MQIQLQEEEEGVSSVEQLLGVDFQLDGKCSYSLYGAKVKSWYRFPQVKATLSWIQG